MPETSRVPRRMVYGVLLLAAGAAALAAWHFTRSGAPPAPDGPTPDPPPPDPRLVFDTPFRNVKPDVRYVGDAACAGCHPVITESYHAHPMGRSAEYVSRAAPVEKYDPSGRAVFAAGGFDLEVGKTAAGVRHHVRLRDPSPVPVPEMVLPAEIAIGSGTRGRSYLTVDRGSVWQTPISWFGPEQRWDVSPGFQLGNTVRRPIAPVCLFCHVDRVEAIPGAENRYREPLFPGQVAIGCERCHGPGALHVAEREAGAAGPGPDTSLVNPRHLSPALQLAVCEQCHLQGEAGVNRRGRDPFEFRPGLPFELFVSVFVRRPDLAEANKSVGQFEQMEQSTCFMRSSGRLTCTSCHDPHRAPAPAAREAHYRGRCLTCHESPGQKGCALPPADRQAKNDSCIACHMLRAASANVAHASVTDHRVPRVPGARRVTPAPPPGTPPLVRFRPGSLVPPEEQERDLGIALTRFAQKPLPNELIDRSRLRLFALDRLGSSLARWPGDADAWVAMSTARAVRAEAGERLKAATTAAALAPESESALMVLVDAAAAAGEHATAEDAAGRRIRLNPTASDPLVARAFLYLKRSEWAKAEADCRAALAIQPLHPESRLYLAICLYHLGDRAAGLREAQTAARLESDPRQRAVLMDWYLGETR